MGQPDGVDVTGPELVLEHTVNALHALAQQLVIHTTMSQWNFSMFSHQLEDVVHTANSHPAHGAHLILGHVGQGVAVAVGGMVMLNIRESMLMMVFRPQQL